MKKSTGMLLIILAVSIALRSIGLESRGIWYDDAFSFFLSRQSLAEILPGTAADTMPPLYYLLLHAWMQISQQVWFLRLLNVLLSVLTVYLFYRLVRQALGEQAALWAAFLAAISPLQIYLSHELRSYTLLGLGQLTYLYFFLLIWQQKGQARWWNWAGMVLGGVVALYCHNLAIFVLVVPDAFLLLRREFRLLRSVIGAQVVTGLAALPWLLLLPGQMANIQSGWSIQPPGVVEVLQILIMSISNLPLPGVWMAAALLLSLWVLVLLGFELARMHAWEKEVELLALAVVLPPVLMFAASYLIAPVLVPRGLIFSNLAYLGLLGYATARRWPRAGVFLLGLAVAGAAIGLSFQVSYHEFPRSDFRGAAAALSAEVEPGSLVLHDNKLSGFPMIFYAPQLPQKFIADAPGGHNDTYSPASQRALGLLPEPDLESAVGSAKKVYFVVFTRAIQEYAGMTGASHPSLDWLRSRFTLVEHQSYSDLEVYKFQR